MDAAASWVTPLLLIPGVGLLIVSTAARYEAVHAEIHALLQEGTAEAAGCSDHVVRSARLFRGALLALYTSAALFGIAGLAGGVLQWLAAAVHPVTWILSAVGIACLVCAAVLLVRESTLSLRTIEGHARELRRRGSGGDDV